MTTSTWRTTRLCLLLAMSTASSAFVLLPPRQAPLLVSHIPLRSSAPSDSASDDSYFSEYESTAADDNDKDTGLVEEIVNLLPTNFVVDKLSPQETASINEALYKLETLNPHDAMSPLLNGVWELRYIGGYAQEFALNSPTRQLALFLYSGGYSPGLFCYQLALGLPKAILDLQSSPLTITIGRSQPRVEAGIEFKVLGNTETVKVQARLEVESELRLRETYQSVTVLGREQPLPGWIQYARDLYVTYVDEDLLVVRDASGIPEVLVRPDKQFRNNWGNEPSSFVDLTPPGDGDDPEF